MGRLGSKSRFTGKSGGKYGVWLDLQETAISAVILCVVLLFAGYYNHQTPHRVRRSLDDNATQVVNDAGTGDYAGNYEYGFSNDALKGILGDDMGVSELDTGDYDEEYDEVIPFELEDEDGGVVLKSSMDDLVMEGDMPTDLDPSLLRGGRRRPASARQPAANTKTSDRPSSKVNFMAISKGEDHEYAPEDLGDKNVIVRTGKRKRRKKLNVRQFKLSEVPLLHQKFLNTFKYRQETVLPSFLQSIGVELAAPEPVETMSDFEKEIFHIKDGKYPDYSSFEKTPAQIQKMLDEFEFDLKGTRLFQTGMSQLWILLPAAVPLFTEEPKAHVELYRSYFQFARKFQNPLNSAARNLVKFSLGLYHKGAVFSPRGNSYRPGRFPWGRVMTYYKKPRTTSSMPYAIATAESLLEWIPKFGGNSPAAGQDCYTIWVHQDIAADIDQFLIPEKFQKIEQLNSLCHVIHVFVGVEPYNENTMKYAAVLKPGLQTKYAKDPNFSGIFFARDFEELNSIQLNRAIWKYMTLMKARVGCRLVNFDHMSFKKKTPILATENIDAGATTDIPPTQLPVPFEPGPTEALTLLTLEPDATLLPMTVEEELAQMSVAPTMRGLIAPVDDALTVAPKVPHPDSCCGSSMFTSLPYDPDLRTCCADGSVHEFDESGQDPCPASMEFNNF